MSICPCNCKYHRSIDIKTPRMVPLSAFFKRSFAFHSVRERFPIVIKRIMEDLMKRRDEFAKQYGEPVREELKKTVDELAALKYELQSNKELIPIISNDPDAAVFNDYLQRKKAEDGHTSPYNTSILYAEAYLYRRLHMIFEKKKILKDYDCFKKFKEDAFEDAITIMRELAIHMEEGCECISDKDAIFDLMKITLWSNKYDLSINKGVEHGIHLNMARKLEPNVVCDHSEAIWEAFRSNRDNDSIAYVPNNAGYELFCDLCLADMLTTKGLTSHVTFHLKTIPSYVSDVTKNDMNWMIQTLKKHVDPHLRCLGQRWDDYVASKVWEIEDDPFWHYPLDYTYMQEYAPALHSKLATVNLIIFKGDLAYRKLFGDINWDPNTPVDKGLRGFLPAKLCVLRTIKYGVVCGIPDDVAEKCMKADNNWKESGNYGVIQYCDTIYVEPPQEEMVFPPDPGAERTVSEEGPKGATDEVSVLDEEGPQLEVEGGGDLGQAEESGRERETKRGDDVAEVVAGLVGETSQKVDNEWGEEHRPDASGQGASSSYQEGETSDEGAEDAARTDHHAVDGYDQTADKSESRPDEHLPTETREDHPSTVEDHPSIVGDHPLKVEDHPLTVEDHPSRVEDHPTAMEDHSSKAEDHPTSVEDHSSRVGHPSKETEDVLAEQHHLIDEDNNQVEKDHKADIEHSKLEENRLEKKEEIDKTEKYEKAEKQEVEDYAEKTPEDDDRDFYDKNRTDNIPPAGTSQEQGTRDIQDKKKDFQRNVKRWTRFVNRLKKIRKEKQDAENIKLATDNEGKEGGKLITTTPQVQKDEVTRIAPSKDDPNKKNAEKLRSPDTPSEVSVNHAPGVDGEEAPE